MKQKRKKEVEYKDTFEFKIFPEYTYTQAQKKRFRLFQGRIEHWKAAINYADKFDNPNEINLVYMIGYSENMYKYVQNTKTNLVVLAAKIPHELLDTYDAYWKKINSMSGTGYCDKEGNLSPGYLKDRQKLYEFGKGKDATADIMIDRYKAEEKIFDAYNAAIPEINKYYRRYTIIDKVHPEKTIDHKDIDKIIKRYFPCGREQCKISDQAYKPMRLMEKAVECGLADGNGAKLLGMPEDDEEAMEVLRKNVKRMDMNINVALRESGNVKMADLFEQMKAPPWGWDEECFAAYCFAAAFRNHLNEHWIFDSCVSWPVGESNGDNTQMVATKEIATYILQTLRGKSRHVRDFCLFDESGWHLCDRLALMFDTEVRYPLTTMVLYTCQAIEKHTRFPVDLIDDRLVDILRPEDDALLLDNEYVKSLTKYFDWDKCKQIREKYDTINEDTKAFLSGKFPDITDEDIRFCTTQSSGWVWKKGSLYECIYTRCNKFTLKGVREMGWDAFFDKRRNDIMEIFNYDIGKDRAIVSLL